MYVDYAILRGASRVCANCDERVATHSNMISFGIMAVLLATMVCVVHYDLLGLFPTYPYGRYAYTTTGEHRHGPESVFERVWVPKPGTNPNDHYYGPTVVDQGGIEFSDLSDDYDYDDEEEDIWSEVTDPDEDTESGDESCSAAKDDNYASSGNGCPVKKDNDAAADNSNRCSAAKDNDAVTGSGIGLCSAAKDENDVSGDSDAKFCPAMKNVDNDDAAGSCSTDGEPEVVQAGDFNGEDKVVDVEKESTLADAFDEKDFGGFKLWDSDEDDDFYDFDDMDDLLF